MRYSCNGSQERIHESARNAQKHTLWCECTTRPLQLPCRAKQSSSSIQLEAVKGVGGAGRVRRGETRSGSLKCFTQEPHSNSVQDSCGPGLLFGPQYASDTDVIWCHWSHQAEHISVYVRLSSALRRAHFFRPCHQKLTQLKTAGQESETFTQAVGQACCDNCCHCCCWGTRLACHSELLRLDKILYFG